MQYMEEIQVMTFFQARSVSNVQFLLNQHNFIAHKPFTILIGGCLSFFNIYCCYHYGIIKVKINICNVRHQDFKDKTITEVKEMARSVWKRLHLQYLPDLALITAKQNILVHITSLTFCTINKSEMHESIIMYIYISVIRCSYHQGQTIKLSTVTMNKYLSHSACLDILIISKRK